MLKRRLAVMTRIAMCAALAACASGGKAATGASATSATSATAASRAGACEIVGDTLILKPGGPVYRDCGVDERARILSKTAIDFNASTKANENCYRTSVEFVVDEKGLVVPETMRFIRRTDQAFQDAVIRAIPNWKYIPARRNGVTVRQLVREDPQVSMARDARGGRPSRPGC